MRRLLGLVCLVVSVVACQNADAPSPVVSAAFDIVAGPGVDLAAGTQEEAVVAFDGTNYLLAWSQSRGSTGYDILGVRVSAAGDLLGSPFVISGGSGDQTHPAIAFGGAEYLVVWQDQRLGGDKEIFGARVTPAGDVLDTAGVNLSREPGAQVEPDVAFDGTNFVAVWEDRTSDPVTDVSGMRVAPTGQLVDAAPLAVSRASGLQLQPSVACGAAGCLVAWRDGRNGGPDVWGARILGGVVLDPGGIAITRAGSSQGTPAVATDGSAFLVVWNDSRNGNPDVYGARVAADGTIRDPTNIAIAKLSDTQQAPAVAFEGAYYVVVWEDHRSGTDWSVYATRIDGAGAVLDASGFQVESGVAGQSVAIASDGAGRALVACDRLVVADPLLPPVSRVRARFVTVRAPLSVTKIGNGRGSVASTPAGIDCGGLCSAMFDAPTGVSLVATPDADSAFMGWSGACSGTGACDVTLDVPRDVTAKFSPYFPLSVTKQGGAGTVQSQPAGIGCGGTCSTRFVEDTVVQLVPTPDAGFAFAGWTGPCTEPQDPTRYPGQPYSCTFGLRGPTDLVATFAPAYKLSVTAGGTAFGTVSGAGIRCETGGPTEPCSSYVLTNAAVELVARPADGAILKRWAGCTSSTGDACAVTMSGPRSISATFEPAMYALNARSTGGGAGTITGAGLSCVTGSEEGCAVQVANGDTVTLEAAADASSIFKGWLGCTSTSGTSCTVTMTTAKSVTATFQPSTYPLTIAWSGGGGGTMTGEGITCLTASGAPCTTQQPNGATITLIASPDLSSIFKGWAGCTSASGATCTVSMTAPRTVTATLQPSTYRLLVYPSGSGTVQGEGGLNCAAGATEGCAVDVANGAMTTLTAVPQTGWILKRWMGCTSSTADTCTVTMSGVRSITATFEPATYTLTTGSTGGGGGTITGAGLGCTTGSSAGCTVQVANGATVTLQAAADASSVFKSWGGCTSTSGTSCTVTMTTAKNLTVTFQPSTYPLTVASTGGGGGTFTGEGVTCTTASGAPCTSPQPNGATISFAATPDASSVFKGWSGCTSVSGATCNVTMTGPKTVTATLQPSTYALNVTATGSGTVTGAGIACSSASTNGCSAQVPNGDTATLVASPAEGWILKSWLYCPSVSGSTCTAPMTMARAVVANFEPAVYTLTVVWSGGGGGTIEVAGTTCSTASGAPCTVAIPNGATATATATPDAASLLNGWSGCASVSGATCTVSMTTNRMVTALLQPSAYPLTVSVVGSGSIAGGPIACSSGSAEGCAANVANGATVSLVATPAAGWLFKYWTGCPSASGTTCTTTMTSAKNVTATFQPSAYPLTIAWNGGGGGTFTGEGITCTTASGAPCTTQQPNGATISLTASPDLSSLFKGWVGCTSVSGATCTVSMTGPRTVTATLQPSAYRLTVYPSGGGTVQGEGGLQCRAGATEGCAVDVANGATTTLTAVPDAGWILKRWAGCTSSTADTCTVAMTGARSVTATFELATYALTAGSTGGGAGTITGAGLACTTGSAEGCAVQVANGGTVTLQAAADASSIFKGWSGCTSSSGASCTVTMTTAKAVTATFQPSTYPLTVMSLGTGAAGTVTGDGLSCTTGSSAGCSTAAANGSTVTLTAVASPGSVFKWWSGCTTASGTTCTVSMVGARSVTATFQPATYPLTVTTAGTGTGTVTAAGIACTSGSTDGCSANQPNGDVVTLTATPGECSSFTGWSGACIGTSCTLQMSAARNVTATFTSACTTP